MSSLSRFARRDRRSSSLQKARPRAKAANALRLEHLEDRSVPSTLWTQRGGDAGHTSFVDTSFDPADLVEVWNAPLGYPQSGTGSWSERAVAIDSSHVYRTALEGYAPSGTYHIIAYNLDTGTEAWHRTFIGNAFEGVGEPSVAGGIVYVNRAGHSGISGGTDADLPRIYGLSAATGATVLEHRYQAQWGSNERPAIRDTQLISEDGYYGGMSSFTTTTLSRNWTVPGHQTEKPFAAIDDQFIYAYGDEVYSRSGVFQQSITHPAGPLTITSPMVSDSGRVFYRVSGTISGSAVYGIAAYDGDTHTHLWTHYTPVYPVGKAVGNGVVAVTAGRDLLLLNESDGSLIRSWQAPSSLTEEVILTRTHAFVQSAGSTFTKVHAIDLATGQEVWNFEHRPTTSLEAGPIEMALAGDHLILSHHMFVRAFSLGSINQAPVATGASATIAEDTTISGTLAATDADGDTLTYQVTSGPAHGSFPSFDPATGAFTYRPIANYSGDDSFTFTATDSRGAVSNVATVNIAITPVNDAPQALGYQFGTNEDTPLNQTLKASDADGDALNFTLLSQPTQGTVELINASTGAFIYTPPADYHGTVSFSFKVNDGTLDSTSAPVYITVFSVNDVPVAADQSLMAREDTPVSGNLVASDADGNNLTYSILTGPTRGTLSFNANGAFTYTPFANLNGPDSFTFKANDGQADSNVATMSITVDPVNDAPESRGAAIATDEDLAVGGLLGGIDVDGDSLTAIVETQPLHGTLTVNPDRTYLYTPAADYNGPDSFSFRVSDGQSTSGPATVSITVNPVNDAPTVAGGSFSLAENSANGTAVGSVSGHDVDGDALTYRIVSGNTGGAFAIDGNTGAITVASAGALDFETTPLFNLTVEVRDSAGLTGTAAFTIQLLDVAEAPQVVIDVVPGDPTNQIVLGKKSSKFQIAIFSSTTFDATQIDIDTIRFGSLGDEDSLVRHKQQGVQYQLTDLNGDGRLDLVVTVDASRTGLQIGDTTAVLTGQLLDGTAFSAEDSVLVVQAASSKSGNRR